MDAALQPVKLRNTLSVLFRMNVSLLRELSPHLRGTSRSAFFVLSVVLSPHFFLLLNRVKLPVNF